MSPTKSILITGDVIVDCHVYVGDSREPLSQLRTGTLLNATPGGAELLHNLVAECAKQLGAMVDERPCALLTPSLALEEAVLPDPTSTSAPKPEHLHGYGLYSLHRKDLRPLVRCPDECKPKEDKVWRIESELGYGIAKSGPRFTLQAVPGVLAAEHDIWLIDDAGLDFRDERSSAAWPPGLQKASAKLPREWLVVKMAAPLAAGDFWQTLMRASKTRAEILQRTIVIVDVEDVRCESAQISRGVSWERTGLDLAKAIEETPALHELSKCRYLIVKIGAEGAALAYRDNGVLRLRLVFDPEHQEEDWSNRISGKIVGRLSCFTAGVLSRLPDRDARPSAQCDQLTKGIIAGLSALREFVLNGHGPKETPALQLEAVAKTIVTSDEKLKGNWSRVTVPRGVALGMVAKTPANAPAIAKTNETPPVWRILERINESKDARTRFSLAQARLVAQYGISRIVSAEVPFLRMGNYVTVDRGEIESLRGLRKLIVDYAADKKADRPLSIGVFGQPGAGKSFSVKELAKATLDDAPTLEFNLSQLSPDDEKEMIGAFHLIRDQVLKNKLPMVFWDEFDSKQMIWLARLLAPMQDGAFLEGPAQHPIGRCVFIFAGGTSYDFDSFGPPEIEPKSEMPSRHLRWAEEKKMFRERKGPDFRSRLSGFLNVAGPNRRKTYDWVKDDHDDDPNDTGFPLRRALLLRGRLRVKETQKVDIDPALLTALLSVERYKNGARSMEKLVEFMSARAHGGRIRVSHLPPDEILNLHVDADEFRTLLDRDLKTMRALESFIDALAAVMHDNYCAGVRQGGGMVRAELDKPFAELSAHYQESNIQGARRMGFMLALAGLNLEQGTSHDPAEEEKVKQRIELFLEIMAEEEHNAWVQSKLNDGWRLDKNLKNPDSARKLHPYLVDYPELEEAVKDKDRAQVRGYPGVVKQAGYRIVMELEPKESA